MSEAVVNVANRYIDVAAGKLDVAGLVNAGLHQVSNSDLIKSSALELVSLGRTVS